MEHLIPTASHDRFLIKASFTEAQVAPPTLEVGNTKVRGQSNAAAGDFWQFDVTGLSPATPYKLSLKGAGGKALCEPWQLATFPAPDATPERLRVMIYTCGGGHDGLNSGRCRRAKSTGCRRRCAAACWRAGCRSSRTR